MDAIYARTGVEANSFGKYRLIAGLGRGGMAIVHLAVMHGPGGFNKLVVLKQIHPEYVEDPEILGMFRDEAQLAARLSHPNVVQTNEVGQEGERHFLAMEYLDGQPLSRITRRLARSGGLPLVLHLRVIADLLRGLHYAHELTDYDGAPLGIVHRDVTPQNVFVTYDGGVKIVDFGIAKAVNALIHTRIGIIKGKIAYMAPEQARGENVDRRADIFAVGVMLWEAATGARPWEGLPELSVLERLLLGKFPAPRSVEPEISPVLEAIIQKATAHDREERHATALDLASDIEAYIQATGERVQQRELSKVMSSGFAGERAKIKAIIEEQLRETTPSSPRALPIIDESSTSGHSARVTPPGGKTLTSGREPSSLGPNTLRARSSRLAINVITTIMERPPGRRGRFARTGALLLVGAALVISAAVMLKRAPPRAEASSPVRTSMPVVNVPTALAAAPSSVMLSVSVSPPEARMLIDDVPILGNPYRGDVPRDGATHRIRITAPGFVDRTEIVTFDKDQSFELVLAGTPAEPTAPLPSARSMPRHPTQRTLDNANPYGH